MLELTSNTAMGSQSEANKTIITRPVSWTLLLALAIMLSQCEGRPRSQEKKPKPEDNNVEKAKKKDSGTDKIVNGKDEKGMHLFDDFFSHMVISFIVNLPTYP